MDKTKIAAEGNDWTERRIRDGFPGAPDDLDAAFVWSGNGRIYFIKGQFIVVLRVKLVKSRSSSLD